MTVLSEHMQSAFALTRNNRSRSGSTDLRNLVLLRPDGTDNVSVVCADSTTETQVRIKGSIDDAIAIAPQLCDLVQTLKPGVNIKLTPTEKSTCKVQTGKSKFTLPAAPAENFPRFQEELQSETSTFSVSTSTLANALNSVSCGLSKPAADKPFTGGILFKCTSKGVFLVGTSGFKLVSVAIAAKMADSAKPMEGVVPEMGVAQIQRLASAAADDDRITFTIGSRQILAVVGNAQVRSRLIACNFPDYVRVTKVDDPFTVQVSKASSMAILKRVGLFVQDTSPFVSLSVGDGKLTFTVKTVQGECVENLDLDSSAIHPKMDGKATVQAHLNITYLASILESMPQDQVTLDFATNLLRVRGSGQTHNAVAIAAYYRA